MLNKDLIIGIDGGGTGTRCILFDSKGYTLDKIQGAGSNLYVFKEEGVKVIVTLMQTILEKNKLNYSDISCYGIAIAGISDLKYREVLLKELDRKSITKNTILLSDVEAAYQILCPKNNGILINVGTGIVCFSRTGDGKSIREAGNGHDKGDVGSGYWLGKELFSRLVLNEAMIFEDSEINQIFEVVKYRFGVNSFRELYDLIEEGDDMYSQLSSMGEDTLDLAESGNDIALSITQEGTRFLSDYILNIKHKLNLSNTDLALAINGSVIKNNFYRKLLKESLEFDFNSIHWISSDLSPAYGAGIMAARYKKINISLNDIVKALKN
jgi:N-acetylglucosamine kinase-like BadF-type ATPase